jgi:3-oxoacyl-(acyl-carrier-protein) synthase
MQERVVVTGLGPLSPRAACWEVFWKLCRARADEGAAADPAEVAGGLHMSEARPASASSPRQVDRLSRLTMEAVALALDDAELDLSEMDPEDVGIAFGTGYGCLASNVAYLEGIIHHGSRYGNPVVFQNTVPNAAAGYASVAQGIRGPNATFSSGSTAGLEALDFGFQQIAEGRVQAMLVASGDCLCPQLVERFAARGQLSPSGVARPFDRDRDGTLLSEGACALVLEGYNSAQHRGAIFYAELLATGQGGGSHGDRHRPLTAAVGEALREARLEPEQVDVVISSASGAVEGDRDESAALWHALGDHAGRVPTTCPKSVLGETMGNSGTFGAVLAALILNCGWVPPTAHYRVADPRCRLNIQSGPARQLRPQIALVPVLGEDGSAAAAVLRRCA